MAVNSLQKGKRNERQLAKTLSAWWGGEFHRTPSSGAFFTQHKQTQLDPVRGDLVCPADFPFTVETKSYKVIDLYDLIRNGKKSEIYQWWEQACNETGPGKEPLVIFKENQKQYYCIADRDMVKEELGINIDTLTFGTVIFFPLTALLALNKETIIGKFTV